MIEEVLIIRDGICAFHRTYNTKSIANIDVSTGFFQALLMFAQEMGEIAVKTIVTERSRFNFTIQQGYAFLLRESSDSKLQPDEIAKILRNISTKFHQQFPEAAESTSVIDSTQYETFSAICDEITNNRPVDIGMPLILSVYLEPYTMTVETDLMINQSLDRKLLLEFQQTVKNYQMQLIQSHYTTLFEPFCVILVKSKKIAYVLPFCPNETVREPIFLLTYLLDDKQWVTFYQIIPLIKREGLKIVNTLSEYIKLLQSYTLPDNYEQLRAAYNEHIEQWTNLTNYISNTEYSFYTMSQDLPGIDEGSIRILLDGVVNALGVEEISKIIAALITQQRIIFVGNELQVKRTILALLTFFIPPSVDIWTLKYSENILIGTTPDNMKLYNQDTDLIIDLSQNKVHGGYLNKLCIDMLNETHDFAQQASFSQIQVTFQAKIHSLYYLIKSLLEMFSVETNLDEEVVKELLQAYPDDSLDLIITVCSQINLLLAFTIGKIKNSTRN